MSSEYVSTACTGRGRATVLPPSEQKGAVRVAEMRELYGAGAAMIQGMETAMQLTFDRNTDRHKPRPWPALPLNIQFDDATVKLDV
jgi:Gemini of Cajal bodies-associated protein 8